MVATLNALQGHRLQVGASGPQAGRGARRDRRPGRAELRRRTCRSEAPSAASGSGLDVAIGPAVVVDAEVDLSGYAPGDDERRRLDEAVSSAAAELEHLRDTSPDHGGIFDAHLALLTDHTPLDASTVRSPRVRPPRTRGSRRTTNSRRRSKDWTTPTSESAPRTSAVCATVSCAPSPAPRRATRHRPAASSSYPSWMRPPPRRSTPRRSAVSRSARPAPPATA